jgi:predicted aspartyl protease
MIVFDYHKNSQGIYFPIIPVTLIDSESKKFDTTALIDSGANISIFNYDVAKQLGVEIEKGEEVFLGGVGGRIKGYIHEIIIEVSGKSFKIPVVLSREYLVSFNLLGRKGFFEEFKIAFDEKNRIIELT